MPVPSSIMFMVPQTNGNGGGGGSVVLCSKCGIPMQPNASNMCVECLCSEVDITEGLPWRMTLVYCPECETYLPVLQQQQRPRSWVDLQSKSKELLSFFLEKLRRYMNKKNANIAVTLLHAEFMCSEHHPRSRMLNLKVRVQKVVLNGAILEFSHPLEVAEQENKHMYCESCYSRAVQEQEANPHHWLAAVQLRQHHVSHWRTFFYLEQRILNRGAAATAMRIKKHIMDDDQVGGGIDFFFSNRRHAFNFMRFLGKVAPLMSRVDNKQLVSNDPKTYKFTFSVEISPICRDDLISLLPPNPINPNAAATLGGPLVICTKVANVIVLLNPCNLRHCSIDADKYWSAPFQSLLTSKQLVEYIVLHVGVVVGDDDDVPSEATIGGTKYVLADAQVARVKDYYGKNKNDTPFSIKTHLGHILKPGDYALGYDLLYGADSNSNTSTDCAAAAAILVKKSYQVKRQKRHRSWKLKSLDMEVDDKEGRVEQDKMESEYEQFLNDLEENPDLRFGISLYRNHDYQPSEMMELETDGEELPSVPWEELRADLDPSEEMRRKMRRIA